MSPPVRRFGAFLALSGLLGMSALAGVTALHVLLEHSGRRDTVAHTHGTDGRTTNRQAHLHAPGTAVPRYSHSSPHDLHHAEAPKHDHVLLLTADLRPGSGRLRVALLAQGPAEATPSRALGVVPAPLSPPSRAGPVTRTAPPSSRSVVLQL